jgi:hypothetical protein
MKRYSGQKYSRCGAEVIWVRLGERERAVVRRWLARFSMRFIECPLKAAPSGERIVDWLLRNRWLVVEYERKTQTSETFIEVALICLLLARLGEQIS